MSSILLTAPVIEPLSLDEAKAFLRVEHDDDDEAIASLIAGARIHIEALTRRALISQIWRLSCDAWPADGRLKVSPAPLREVVAARVYDADGTAHAIDVQAFVPDVAGCLLAFAPWAMPQPGRIAAGIEIDVCAGYGEAALDVPEALRQAVRLLAAHWYENRSLVTTGSNFSPLPTGVSALIAPYRVLAL